MSDLSQLSQHDVEVLKRRAQSLAARVDEESPADLLSLLLFRASGEWFAVPVSDVREIFGSFTVMPLPCVPAYVLGVVNVRGEIVSVIDPGTLMGLTGGAVAVSEETPAIVLVSDEVVSALVVDEIGDIAEIAAGDFETAAGIVSRGQAEYLSASFYHEGSMVGLLNTARVLEPVVTTRR